VLVATRATADGAEAKERRLAMANRVLAEATAAAAVQGVANLHAPDAPAELVARAEALARRQRPEAVAWVQRAMAARPDSGEVLRTRPLPAVVVAGEHDRVVARAESVALADLLATPLVVVPRAGHLVPWEEPAEFAAVLAEAAPRLAD